MTITPRSIEDLSDVKDLRPWQIAVLGEDFVKTLANGAKGGAAANEVSAPASDGDSPYRDG